MDPTLQEPTRESRLEPSREQERDLVAQASASPEAFERLYNLYFPRVYSYIRYRVGHTQSAEDVVADVFLKVVRGLEGFRWRHEGSFAAWLFRIARNEALAYHRRNGGRPVALSLEELPDAEAISADAPLPEESALRDEKGESIRRLIVTLPRRRQEVITLRFFAELQNHEIAAVLDLDERTVASHLCRALRDLHARWLVELARQEGVEERSV